MSTEKIPRTRICWPLIGYLVVLIHGGSLWAQVPLWDPPAIDVFPEHNRVARNPSLLSEMIQDGQRLFEARFNQADGVGRPASTGDSKPTFRPSINDAGFIRTSGPDANSCAGCHNQPRIGGSGDFAANAFVGAQFADPPTSSILTSKTSERNTISVFGSAAIELLAREMTADLQQQRSEALKNAERENKKIVVFLESKDVKFGSLVARPDGTIDARRLEGVDTDLVIKPFGAKGVVISLREFTINALNQHHGIQAYERFGWERTGRRDFDEDGVEVEFTIGQVSALVMFQATLPPPSRKKFVDHKREARVRLGEELFQRIGCDVCHVPRLPLRSSIFLEPNPYNRPGNLVPSDVEGQIALDLLPSTQSSGLHRAENGVIYVAAYTDLKRHQICDEEDRFFCNEELEQDFVPTDQFLTSKLWDAGTSAPYGHRGDCTTISEAILHHSAEAKEAKESFLGLEDNSKIAVVEFLRSLIVPSMTGGID